MAPDPDDTLALWILPFGAAALAVIAWLSWWRPRRLAAAPARSSDLQWSDLLVALGLWVMGQSAAVVLIPRLTGGADPTTLGTAAQAGLVLLGQVLGQGVPVAYFIWRATDSAGGPSAVGLWPRRPVRELGLAAAALLLALPMVFSAMVLATWVGEQAGQAVPESGHPLLEVFRTSDSALGVALLLASVVLIGPALEEALYRGMVQSVLLARLEAQRRVWVIVIASVLFTAVHMGAATFDAGAQDGVPWQMLPGLLVLALVLGWLYEYTGSLWPSIGVHAGFNAFNVAVVMWTG